MLLSLRFLRFWFFDAPKELFAIFGSLNTAFLQLFSLPLLVKTFFKPWKNEYREGLVGFAIGMGMAIKTIVILADIFLLSALLLLEFIFVLSFVLWPITTLFFFQRLPLFLLSLLYILVVFFLFKPKSPIDIASSKKSVIELIKTFLKRKDVQVFLQKGDIKKEEIQFIEITKESILKDINGIFTPLDFFTTYLLLTEDKTKLLFNKKLKTEDLLQILHWARGLFPKEKKPFRIQFFGEGVFESWTYGWTLETKKYMVDLTPEVLNKKPFLLGRQSEFRELVSAMLWGKSVILVGEPGSGKNALAEALGLESFSGSLKENLYHQRVFKLFVDTLLAGAENQGELEKRLDNIISEVSHAGNVIIYISDFENILGSASFKMDLSGVIVPYLKNKSIRIIGTATEGAYKKFIEPMVSLSDVFEIIKLTEPQKDLSLKMLLDKSFDIEKRMKVVILYRAVLASLDFSDRYLMDKVLPGRAVTLLEDTANEVRLSGKKKVAEEDVIKRIEEKTKIKLSFPTEEEKNLILNLEERMHRSLIDQKEAVSSIAEGIRRIRSGLNLSAKPISFLFLGPTGVGKTQTAKVLSSLYFGGEEKMIRFDMSEYTSLEGVERFIGLAMGGGNQGISGKVHENPSTLILLDEFEKAHPNVHNLFLQVLDDGRLTDNNGKTVSFANAIIVATSNAGSEFIREAVQKGVKIDKNFKDQFLEYILSRNILRPELLNRFDDVVVFKPLTKEDIEKITKILLDELVSRLREKDIEVSFDVSIINKVVREGFDEVFGARPIRRYIQDNIEDLIAKKLLNSEIKRGDSVSFSIDEANNFLLKV